MALQHILSATALFLASLPSSAIAHSPASPPAFNRAAWKADYERLKLALARDYANLDWQVERRGLNLARADQMVSDMLDRAQDDTAATLAMVKLIDAFRDPHLQLKAGPVPGAMGSAHGASDVTGPFSPSSACEEAGYTEGRAVTRLPYAAAPGWAELSAAPFQAGMIGDIGIIRIPDFGEDQYLQACKAAAKAGLDGRALQLATRAELNRRLVALLETLKAKGMKRLAIDISRNGGGSEWSSEAVTLFAPGRMQRTEPRRGGPTCDRSTVWKGEKPACSPYRTSPTTEWIEGKPAWMGPLAILADRRTASAAEEFISWLRDNGRAVMGGERTFGAGCGYMDGGAAFQFTAVSMHLMIPNCSRFTRDGANEIEGQAPDLSIDWQQLKPEDVPATLNALFALEKA